MAVNPCHLLSFFRSRYILVTASLIVIITTHKTVDGLLISGSRIRRVPEENVTTTTTTTTTRATPTFHSSGENTILTDLQSISLKEIRKLARLAGHADPKVITDIDQDTCYKDDCLDAAREFYMSMDLTEDPCTDFGKFACEWRTLSSDTGLDQHALLALRVDQQVREILQDPDVDEGPLQMAISYYQTCVSWFEDFSRIDHISSFLETIGSWPLLSRKKDAGPDRTKLLAQVMRITPEHITPLLLKLEAVALNEKDDAMAIKIDSGLINVDIDSENVKKILEILRKTSASSLHRDELEEIREMQKGVQTLTESRFDATINPKVITLQGLQEKLSKDVPDSTFSIMRLLKAIFDGTDLKITPETSVVTDVNAFIKYAKSIQAVDSQALTNIIFLQLSQLILGDTTNVIDEKGLVHLGKYQRRIFRSPTQHCMKETSEVFNYALSEEYIRRHGRPDAITSVLDHIFKLFQAGTLVEDLKQGFVTTLDQVKWLDKRARDVVQEKIKKVEVLASHPSWIEENHEFDSFYNNIKLFSNGNFNGSRLYLNHRSAALSWLNGKSWKTKLDNELIDGWNDKAKHGFVADTNVEYIPSLNQLRIPAGILQPPLFSIDFPGYLNFGGLGSIVGRELGKIFDSNGIYVNGDGDSGMWFDEKSYKNYIDWTIRLKMEWEKNELNLNDKIKSILGYHITVRGYEEYLKRLKREKKGEPKLPGLSKLLPEKLLQLKLTNVLCESQTLRQAQSKEITSFNSYALFPVSRNRLFAKLFECEMDAFYSSFDFLI